MSRLLSKPKWSWRAVRPIHPLLPGLVLFYIGWMFHGLQIDGLLKVPGEDDLIILGIFFAAIVVGYILARWGYVLMQKAGTPSRRKAWTGVMILGLLALGASLVVSLWRSEYGMPSMYSWAFWSVLILLFEGSEYRPSPRVKRAVGKMEQILGVDLDGDGHLGQSRYVRPETHDDPRIDEDEGEPSGQADIQDDVLALFRPEQIVYPSKNGPRF